MKKETMVKDTDGNKTNANSSSGRIPGGSIERTPKIIGAILGLLSAILCAYLVPILMVPIEVLGYDSVAQYMTQAAVYVCVPVIALWSVPFGIFGSLFGHRVGLKMKSPVAPMIMMIIGGVISGSLSFLLGIPLMLFVTALGG